MEPIRLELPLKISYPTVNAYLFTGPVPTLIDTGLNSPGSAGELERSLKKHGLRLQDVGKVVITHPHVDHIGLAGVLGEMGAEIWLSDLAASWMDMLETARREALDLLLDIMREHGFDRLTIELTDRFYDRLGPMFSKIPEASRRVFRAGDVIDIAGRPHKAIAAPGHSNRQVCFFDEDTKRLFSGDMLLPKTPVPLVEPRLEDPRQRDPGLPALIRSFHEFRALPIAGVFPGHGKPFNDHRGLIDDQLSRIEKRKHECLTLIRSGTGTLPGLLARMYQRLAPQNRLGGLAMLVGYLDLLLAEGKIQPIEEQGVRRYAPTKHNTNY